MEYMPGAATNHSKIKNFRLNTLTETQPVADPRSVIMDAVSYDHSMKDKVEGK